MPGECGFADLARSNDACYRKMIYEIDKLGGYFSINKYTNTFAMKI